MGNSCFKRKHESFVSFYSFTAHTGLNHRNCQYHFSQIKKQLIFTPPPLSIHLPLNNTASLGYLALTHRRCQSPPWWGHTRRSQASCDGCEPWMSSSLLGRVSSGHWLCRRVSSPSLQRERERERERDRENHHNGQLRYTLTFRATDWRVFIGHQNTACLVQR